MRRFVKKTAKTVLAIGMLILIVALAGCSMEVTARGSAYHKNENGGDIYKSRAVEKQNSGEWSWGNAGN